MDFLQQPQTKHHFYKHRTRKDKVCVLLRFFFCIDIQNVLARVAYFAIIGFREQSVWGKGGGWVCLAWIVCLRTLRVRQKRAARRLLWADPGDHRNSRERLKLLDPTGAGEHQGDVMGDWHEKLRSRLASCAFSYKEQFFYSLWFLLFRASQ